MSGVATAIAVTGAYTAYQQKKAGKRAAAASQEAAGLQAQAEFEKLEYLKEREALPQQFREEALTQLAGVYGLPGAEDTQQQMIERAMASPLYQEQIAAIERGVPAAEEALLRTRAATGGLRSGGAIRDIAELAQQREALKSQALTQAYQQQLTGISGLAQLPSLTREISQAMVAPGMTTAQGLIGAAQAQQLGEQQAGQTLMSALGTGLQAYAGRPRTAGGVDFFGTPTGTTTTATYSDIRLKDNIRYIGEKNGHRWFEWEWCKEAEELGLKGKDEGVMAHLVYETNPEAISIHCGLLVVDYEKLGVNHA